MHTRNVNTAAPESSRKMGENTSGPRSPLTMPQLTDLFLYVMAHSERQKQPAFFVPPVDGDLMVARSDDGAETVIVWTLQGWPLAAAVPEAGYLAVLSGIPE